jgi:CPA1 family monovalent cation:H+ antiporter
VAPAAGSIVAADRVALFDVIAVLLVLAAGFGCLNHSLLHLPRSIGVLLLSLAMACGLILLDPLLGADAWVKDIVQSADLPHVFLDGMLAFLLFAGTLHVDFASLQANRRVIFLLATGSVILATVLFGVGLWWLSALLGTPIPLGWCAVLGAALAPTDAVVVEGLLRRMALPPSLRAAISGESLFNDGAGVVMFLVALGVAQGQTGLYGHGRVALALAVAGGGGALVGGIGGWLAALLMRGVAEDGLRLMTSLALVLGTYRLAALFGWSGPIAVVTAGLVLGQMVPDFGQAQGGHSTMQVFWGMLDDLLDTILFLLIGVQVLDLSFGWRPLLLALAAVPLALGTRLLSVAVPAALAFRGPAPFLRGTALLTWGGLRGGVSVALALTLPPTPYSDVLLAVCYAVVVFSIVGQGLTLPGVLRALFGAAAPISPLPASPAQ